MGPYTLTVFHKGRPVPTETVHATRAADVLTRIGTLLEKHADCHRIRVDNLTLHLFTVDCNGDVVQD